MAPQVFVGNLETTVILVHVAGPYITETWESFTSTRQLYSTKPCCTPSVRMEKAGMVLKDKQLTAIQHVHNGNNELVTYGQVDFICGVLPFLSCFASTLERQKRCIAISTVW